jgi:hypothetical protein
MREGIQLELKDAEVNEYGCYALCIIRWAELAADAENEIPLTDGEILRIINEARESGIIGSECFVHNPPALYNLAARANQKTQCVKTTAPSKPISICCNKKPMYTHFTLWADGKTWDPLPPTRPGAAAYKPDSWRVLS